jgi:hypothetical protein
MSYGKKDEDAEQAILKVDRTAVFQEGGQLTLRLPLLRKLTVCQPDYSTLLPYHH